MLEKSPRLDPSKVSIGDLVLDNETRRVFRNGKGLEGISDKSFKVLWVLANFAPKAVSREKLFTEVWGKVHVNDEALNQRVKIIRNALGKGPDGQDYILAVHGTGYRLSGGKVQNEGKSGNKSQTQSLIRLGIAAFFIFIGYIILSEAGVLHLIHKWIN